MRKLDDGEQLEVGDLIVTQTFLGQSKYPITRVTKTLAKSKREDDGYEQTFKRTVSSNLSHPYQGSNWSSTSYEAFRPDPLTDTDKQEQS